MLDPETGRRRFVYAAGRQIYPSDHIAEFLCHLVGLSLINWCLWQQYQNFLAAIRCSLLREHQVEALKNGLAPISEARHESFRCSQSRRLALAAGFQCELPSVSRRRVESVAKRRGSRGVFIPAPAEKPCNLRHGPGLKWSLPPMLAIREPDVSECDRK